MVRPTAHLWFSGPAFSSAAQPRTIWRFRSPSFGAGGYFRSAVCLRLPDDRVRASPSVSVSAQRGRSPGRSNSSPTLPASGGKRLEGPLRPGHAQRRSTMTAFNALQMISMNCKRNGTGGVAVSVTRHEFRASVSENGGVDFNENTSRRGPNMKVLSNLPRALVTAALPLYSTPSEAAPLSQSLAMNSTETATIEQVQYHHGN